MARGGNGPGPSALEAPVAHPAVEQLWAVSAAFGRRHPLPTSDQDSYWMSRMVHERTEAKPLTRARAERRLDVLRMLPTWPTFSERPLLVQQR
jgi:hypothetical protein